MMKNRSITNISNFTWQDLKAAYEQKLQVLSVALAEAKK